MFKNWHKYSKEHFQFILAQSEKKLIETVESMKIIQARGRMVMVIGISIVSSNIAWFASKDRSIELEIYSIALCVHALVAILFAGIGIYKYTISTIGTTSKKLMSTVFYQLGNPKLEELSVIINECRDYDFRIAENKKRNRKRLNMVTLASFALYLIPLSLFILYLLNR